MVTPQIFKGKKVALPFLFTQQVNLKQLQRNGKKHIELNNFEVVKCIPIIGFIYIFFYSI